MPSGTPTLVMDSATARAVCGVVLDGRVVAAASAEGGHAAQRSLVLVDEVLARARLEASELSRVVVGCGPGSFTGLRIGIATARGLALGLGVPCEGVSTLAALAAAAPGALALIDARRGELFTLDAAGDEVVAQPGDVAARSAGALCVGDGALRYRSLLEAAGAVVPPDDDPRHAPGPATLAELAAGAPAEPIYVRRPDAEPRVA